MNNTFYVSINTDACNFSYKYKKLKTLVLQVFSDQVATAMNIYKKYDPDLQDCDSTVAFIQRIGRMITAMTSRSAFNALKKDNESNNVSTRQN